MTSSNAARSIFSSATITVGGLYLTTHSTAVTLIGTTAATALACWTLWLPHGHRTLTGTGAPETPAQKVGDARSRSTSPTYDGRAAEAGAGGSGQRATAPSSSRARSSPPITSPPSSKDR